MDSIKCIECNDAEREHGLYCMHCLKKKWEELGDTMGYS